MQTRNTIVTAVATTAAVLLGLSVSAADLTWLEERADQGDSVSVVIFIENDQIQNRVFQAASASEMTRAQRVQTVTAELRSTRPAGYNGVVEYVRNVAEGPVTELWIVPAISAFVPVDQVAAIAALPGVKLISPNAEVELIAPVEERTAVSLAAGISSHLDVLNVRPLWARGYTGKGRLVCNIDTGVEGDHPALATKWRGNTASLSASWMSALSPSDLPSDAKGHGTHTMGTMVGVDGADTIGVAPGAEWIAAGVVDQGKTLSATIVDILEAFQWTLNPDGDWNTTNDVPDVILNSWGVPAGIFGPCDETFWQAIDNVEAAGIVAIFSAGNEGPNAETLRNPANRASSPINSFAVGAVDDNKVIASFSSRGPSVCNTASVKPEVVAPGVSIRSSTTGGGYKIMSGTSMAAPFIAGLVAICRQYNPDATVEEIKWALINSATDLGETGKDNAYGYGLVDASRLLDFIPRPGEIQFTLLSEAFAAGQVVMPGETSGLTITVSNGNASIDRAQVRLDSEDPGVTILNDAAELYFGYGGTTAVAQDVFGVAFDSAMINGHEVGFTLYVSDASDQPLDTLEFTVTVGYVPQGEIANHTSGALTLAVSDFAQYGMAAGSIYNAGASGFTFSAGENLLYEAGLIIGRNALQLSSSVRDAEGRFAPSDFEATSSLSEAEAVSNHGLARHASMKDVNSTLSLPIVIDQTTIDYPTASDRGLTIMSYRLINPAADLLVDVNFGFLADFDWSGTEEIIYDSAASLVMQKRSDGLTVGVVLLEGFAAVNTLENGAAKTGLDDAAKYRVVSEANEIQPTSGDDLLFVVRSSSFSLEPLDSAAFALAWVIGIDEAAVRSAAREAVDLYQSPTDVDESNSSLPQAFELNQNYPNPFNPTTAISFYLPEGMAVSLDIYNVLGQRVATLVDEYLPAGEHVVEWNATSDSGAGVASGVYFYRLMAGERSDSRKMVLLQ